MQPISYAAFERFLKQCRPALRRISAHTRGEHSLSDVEASAWVLAEELRLNKGISADFDSAEYQQRIISYLYQELVRYTELNVRQAVRLDHALDGAEEEGQHPLLAKLAADENSEPLTILLQREGPDCVESREPEPYESPAAAYLGLLKRFDNKMMAVAAHLLISQSWCYNRFNNALKLAEQQWPLLKDAFAVAEGLEPRTWRKFRAVRYRRQLELNLRMERLI